MILNKEDAYYAANIFHDFFGKFERIDDYMREQKADRMKSYPQSLPGMGPETDLFDKFDMHPNDMAIEIVPVKSGQFMKYLEIVTSQPVESSIPGKQLMYLVKEKNSKQILGMIRFGSPTINSRPRNEWLGKPLDSHNPAIMKRFNNSCIMGFSIVPAQPFGYNALGGKLLSAICCSHFVRRAFNEKYEMETCMFETTSLYGSSTASSQYDGMRPLLRYTGLTDSNFAPLINDEKHRSLSAWFADKNDGVELIMPEVSSRKLKTQTKMVSIIKASLKHDPEAHQKFCQMFLDAKGLTQQKRSFVCTYGYDNVAQYMNLETDTLIKKDNFDRFELAETISWWRKKAAKRFEKLRSENRLRQTLEVWNTGDTDSIDIIR